MGPAGWTRSVMSRPGRRRGVAGARWQRASPVRRGCAAGGTGFGGSGRDISGSASRIRRRDIPGSAMIAQPARPPEPFSTIRLRAHRAGVTHSLEGMPWSHHGGTARGAGRGWQRRGGGQPTDRPRYGLGAEPHRDRRLRLGSAHGHVDGGRHRRAGHGGRAGVAAGTGTAAGGGSAEAEEERVAERLTSCHPSGSPGARRDDQGGRTCTGPEVVTPISSRPDRPSP